MTDIRDEMLQEYLRRQSKTPTTQLSDALLEGNAIHCHNSRALTVVERNEDEENEAEREEFKHQVRAWIRMDSEVKDISAKMRLLDGERKQRKRVQEELSKRIMAYMRNNEIDELNSRDGIIKSKTTYVKTSLSQKALIERLMAEFSLVNNVDDRLHEVFYNREKIEKSRLTRS